MRGTLSNRSRSPLTVAFGAALLSLSACSTTDTPGIKVVTQPVASIQVQHCVDKKDIPVRPGKLQKMPTSLEDALRATLAKIGEWTKYGNTANAVLNGCASADVSVTNAGNTAKSK